MKRRASKVLAEGAMRCRPDLKLDAAGYVSAVLDNVLPGIALEHFESELRGGDGNELERKFLAAHSSSALAVNVFAPFKRQPEVLDLAGLSGFQCLTFERKCDAGIAGRKAPNLDLLAESAGIVVGVESKCTEHLDRHTAWFSDAYDQQIVDGRRDGPWFAEMKRLRSKPDSYQWLDAAQLVKHAFGLAYSFPAAQTTLFYVFWEPSNASDIPALTEHRCEIAEFSARIAGGSPAFVSCSYPQLWRRWLAAPTVPQWLVDHVSRLQARYLVEM